MQKTLAFIHSGPAVTPVFDELGQELLPKARLFHMVDESLLQNTIQNGRLDKTTIRRLGRLVESAGEGGAHAVMVTCSSIGPAVPLLRPLFDFPVLRIDEAMAEEAVHLGKKVGVVATLASTLEPTTTLIRDTAIRMQRECEVVACLCAGAFEILLRGDTEVHDRIVLNRVAKLMSEVSVVALAQASMARILAQLPADQRKVPVLASPRLAMIRASDVIASLG
jgi:Asp/Glu/hydantoin racemase